MRIDEESKKKKDIMQAIFLQGNSSLNIKNGAAFGDNITSFQIVRALFNEGVKEQEAKALGKGVYKNFGVAREGFDISSCQFALHYFFKDVSTLRGFITNLSECTKLNGYFIGTAYDGQKIFDMLKRNNGLKEFRDEESGNVTLSISRDYDENNDNFLLNDSLSLGNQISVFQESIGQNIAEYLINFNYFNRVMQDFGFVPLSKKDATDLGLPSPTKEDFGGGGIGSFEDLFKQYNRDKSARTLEDYAMNLTDMTETEKQISRLSMYFVYQKISNINPNEVIMQEETIMEVAEKGDKGDEEEEFVVTIVNPKITRLKGAEKTLLTDGIEDVQLNLTKKRTQENTQEEVIKNPPKKKNKSAITSKK
jgi:hypothetical protein